VLGGAQHGTAERVIAVGGLVQQLVGHRGGLVVVAVDLLDDHAALAVELVGVDARAGHEVREQVHRGHQRLRARGDVEGDQVVRGVGVELRAEPLGRLVHVAVGRELLAALEDEVLEEVRHPVLVGPLRAGARVERDERGDRARARHPELHERETRMEGRLVDFDHD
jgi:hypothetical protein